LENLVASKQLHPQVDAIVLDGAAIVQMLSPGRCTTFGDYAEQIFVPYVASQLSHVSRLDLVWDQYATSSLKAATRAKRGIGIRRKVTTTGELPRNWADFLRNDDNKTELFHFLSAHIVTTTVAGNKKLVVTDACHVLSCQLEAELPDSALDPCSHEEADTRMLLHAAHAAANGHGRIMIKTVDTDVVVVAIACFERLRASELWIALGVGKNLRYIAVHELVEVLGKDRCTALPFFHAFTGCDTVSSFAGHGKKTGWETWNSFPDVTSTFSQLSSEPTDVDFAMSLLQRFVVRMYERSSSKMTVNSLRKHLFTKKGKPMEGLPPTEAALLQHTKRAVYQSGFCWFRSLQAEQNLPSPGEWGWLADDDCKWKPLWTDLPDVAKCLPELLKCGCKKGCSKRCRCLKANTRCTALCACDGACHDDE